MVEPEPERSFLRGLPVAQAAVVWAVQQHAGQRREADGAAFVAHPMEVASLVAGSDYPDHVVAGAVLHDVLENTDARVEDIEARFGSDVARLVEAVSDDPSLSDEDERKNELRERVRQADGDVLAVYAADKVSKVREIRIALTAGVPRDAVEHKLRWHRESLVMLQQRMPDSHIVELLHRELETFDRAQPR